LETVWTSEKLLTNETIKQLLISLNDNEAEVLIQTIKAVGFPSELTYICNVLARLFGVVKAIDKIDWPDKMIESNSILLSALTKIKASPFYKEKIKIEQATTLNPLHGRIEVYPIASLFCQSFGNDIEEQQKPLIYLLHYILLQISQHNRWDAAKNSALLSHAAHSLRKIVACTNPLKIKVDLEKASYDRLANLLLALTNEGHINFQEQFLRAWSEFYQNKPFVRKAQTKTDDHKARKKWIDSIPNTDEIQIEKCITKTRTGMQLKVKRIFAFTQDRITADETASIDLIETVVPDNVELDHRTKAVEAINGSRLTLIEKKHLPWRTNALDEHEIAEFVSFLKVNLTHEVSESIFLSLSLLTSKPLDELAKCDIYSRSPDISKIQHDFIDLESGTWNRKSVEMPKAFVPAPAQQELLAPHSDWLALPLPLELVDSMRSQLAKKILSNKISKQSTIKLEDLCFDSPENIGTTLTLFLRLFWKNNPHVHRKITPAAIRATVFEKVTHEFDAGYAALMLANTEFDNPTTLYYLAAKTGNLLDDYTNIISSIGFADISLNRVSHNSPRRAPQIDKEIYVGSRLTIDIDTVSRKFRLKREKLCSLLAQKELSVKEHIERFNECTHYTILTLVVASAHRSRAEFGFTSATTDDVTGLSLVSDKINFVDSAFRFLPASESVKKQWQCYRNECAELARALKRTNVGVATQLAKVSANTIQEQREFFTVNYHSDLENLTINCVGVKDMESYLAPEINLPLNFLRHYFCTQIRECGEYNVAKPLMGHVGNGEHLLSDHSLATLKDIAPVSDTIDLMLNKVGIESVDNSAIKGPKFPLPPSKPHLPYLPPCLSKSKNSERSQQLRWVRNLISPYILTLRNEKTHDKTFDTLLQKAVSDNECSIKLSRRVDLLNRFVSKIANSKRWFTLQDETSLLCVDSYTVLNMRQARLIKSEINRWLVSNGKNLTGQEKLARIVCSLLVNSKANLSINNANLTVLSSPPFYENGLAWFEVKEDKWRKPSVIIIDSMSLLLIQKYNLVGRKIKSAKPVKRIIYNSVLHKISKQGVFDVNAVNALKNIESTAEYLRNARVHSTSALTHAFENNRIKTTNLPAEHLCRWLSKGALRFPMAPLEMVDRSFSGTSLFSYEQSESFEDNFKKSKLLLSNLQRNLNVKAEESDRTNTTEIVISTWARFLDVAGETNIDNLVESSNQLDQIIILLFLWLIDVSKRPGRGKGRRTAIRTLKTYISNVAQPLIEQTIKCSFLNLSEEEFGEIYRDAIAARNIEEPGQRAENMRNFHNFVMRIYHCAAVDWFDVEPSIGANYQEADANIISMREYTEALELLKNDDYLSGDEQRINQIILILCYRAGLRSSEATHLKLNDIDTKHWIVHVRSNYWFRTKSIRSNRRIPVNYLLNEDEKKLILAQIDLIKSFHPDTENPWLFSDKTTAECLVPTQFHITRVIESLRIASGDNHIRLHHARHSFANYLLLVMSEITNIPAIYKELEAWARTDRLREFSKEMKSVLVGKQMQKDRILNAISLVLGHASPHTTLSSYIHVLSLMSAAENELVLYETVGKSAITQVLDVERTHQYKILSRGNCRQFGFIPLCSYVANSWSGYQQLICTRQTQTNQALSVISRNDERSIYSDLNCIERIIRLTENGLTATKVTQQLQLDNSFVLSVIKATRSIKYKTGYTGTNISSDLADVVFRSSNERQLTSAKYIKHADFQLLLKKLAHLKVNQRDELCQIFNKAYTPRFGFVVNDVTVKKCEILFACIDCELIDSRRSITVRNQYSKRMGRALKVVQINDQNKVNNDNKIIHAIFLLNVQMLAKKTSKGEL
tara:strand:- start:6730 stop:12210 length:5481 start_codon:yes stop_codon:yes gene_type:complete